MARRDERLEAAVEAAKAACSALAAIAEARQRIEQSGKQQSLEDAAWRAWGLARNAAESLLARARQAPGLLATWGPGAFLVFYASKAADLAEENSQLLNLVIKCVTKSNCVVRCIEQENPDTFKGQVDTTSLGYVLYLAALTRYLKKAGPAELQERIGAGCCNAVDVFDTLITTSMKGKLRQTELLYAVETLSRLTTIYLEPVLGEAKNTGCSSRSKANCPEAVRRLVSGCCLKDSTECQG